MRNTCTKYLRLWFLVGTGGGGVGRGAFCLQWHGGEGGDSSHWRGSLPPAGGSLPADSKSSSICKVCLCLSSVFPPASVSGPLLSFLSVSVSICWALSHFYFLLLLLSFFPISPSVSPSLPPTHLPLSLAVFLFRSLCALISSLSVAVSEFCAFVSHCLSLSDIFFCFLSLHLILYSFLNFSLQLNASFSSSF